MTSYNRLNGFYTAENPELLKTIVREEWGFDGLHITDFEWIRQRRGEGAGAVRTC